MYYKTFYNTQPTIQFHGNTISMKLLTFFFFFVVLPKTILFYQFTLFLLTSVYLIRSFLCVYVWSGFYKWYDKKTWRDFENKSKHVVLNRLTKSFINVVISIKNWIPFLFHQHYQSHNISTTTKIWNLQPRASRRGITTLVPIKHTLPSFSIKGAFSPQNWLQRSLAIIDSYFTN